jgi:pimeloyl-ACP methyl ester carboxylesterase
VSFVAEGGRLRDRFPDLGPLPAWLSEDDLDVYAGEFERTGFTGALNRYRNMDRDWEDMATWDGAPISQPSIFIAGERDPTLGWMGGAIEAFGSTLPGLVGSHVLEGAGHWIQQERPAEVNRLLTDWLETVAD